jgi:hypothetical protein
MPAKPRRRLAALGFVWKIQQPTLTEALVKLSSASFEAGHSA